MKVVALVQARTGSVRLPQKVLKPILNKPMIELLLSRLSRSTELDEIVVATSKEKRDDKLESTVESCLLYTSPSPRDGLLSRMPSSA